jgi:TolB-like protein
VNKKFKIVFVLMMVLFLINCGEKATLKHFVRKEIDPSYIKRVAVLKFENHTKEKNAGKRLRDITTTEILAMMLFDVVDKAVVNVVLDEETGGKANAMDKITLKRIAKKLKVQGLMMGSVDTYEEKRDRNYGYPVVTVTLRLIDGSSGQIIWQAGGTETGYSTMERLFGITPKDLSQVSYRLVERLLKTLR